MIGSQPMKDDGRGRGAPGQALHAVDLRGGNPSLPTENLDGDSTLKTSPTRPANGTCMDCGAALPPQFFGRPRLRCDDCRTRYHHESKRRSAPRPCLGGCGTDLAGQQSRSMCPDCAAQSRRLASRDPRRNYSRPTEAAAADIREMSTSRG